MMNCGPFERPRHNRREMLARSAQGFGGIALASLLSDPSFVGPASAAVVSDPDGTMAPQRTHFPARAKNVIFLYMDGGVSQVDSFDPKPQLAKENGQPFKMKVQPSQFDNVGNVLQSPWKFRQYGESGIPISDLFPHVAQCADDLCVIRSMTSAFPEHTNANYFLHTGHGLQGRPCMGAWTAYGLGTESRDLPGFVVLNGGLIPPGGVDCFHNGFLPATFQGSIFKPGATPVADLASPGEAPTERARKVALLRTLESGIADRMGQHDAVESAIANYELAFRMQTAVPELMDIDSESKSVQESYGLFDKFEHTRTYGQQCLVARRLIERGVRFIELTCPRVKADRWDQHSGLLDGHTLNAKAVDQPIAALLKDLKSRGLLDETLVVWSSEFGRTPMAQGSNGRDHNPFGFTMWMAGGGIRSGTIYGGTDEYGYYAIENKLEIHDLHATMLHLLGIDHTQLTVQFSSREMRLTDVFGHVVHDVIA